MLCLGTKKSLSPPRLVLSAQGMLMYTNDKSQVWYHFAIQEPCTVVVRSEALESILLKLEYSDTSPNDECSEVQYLAI